MYCQIMNIMKIKSVIGVLTVAMPGILWIPIGNIPSIGFLCNDILNIEFIPKPIVSFVHSSIDRISDTLPNSQSWQMHTLDPIPSSGSDGVKLADVNGDGFPDLVSGFEEGGVSRIYLHPGFEKVREYWDYIELPSPDVEDAVLVDLDGRNGIDLIVGSKRKKGVQGDDKAVVGWLRSPENPRNTSDWEYFSLTSAGWIMSIEMVDMNEDEHPDILISDRKFSSQSGVRWLENPGKDANEFYGKWKSHMIGVSEGEPMFLTMADLDGNGSEEILVPDLYNGLVILEKQGSVTQLWKEYNIPYPKWSGRRGKAVSTGDLNSDDQLDIVLSFEEEGKVADIPFEEYKATGKYSVITGTFTGSPFLASNWEFEKVSDLKGRKFDLVNLIDLDGDGDLDVLTNDENEEGDGLGVVWYENPMR